MAHTKRARNITNGRDSNAQRLDLRPFGGQNCAGGTIIVRQRGTRVKQGLTSVAARTDTLFAKITGRMQVLNKGTDGQVCDGGTVPK